MAQLRVNFKASVEAPLPLSMVAVLEYPRMFADEDGSFAVITTVNELQLSNTASGSINLSDYDGKGLVQIAIRTAGGDILVLRPDEKPKQSQTNFILDVTFTAEQVGDMGKLKPRLPVPTTFTIRCGQFIVLGDTPLDVTRRRLLVGLCSQEPFDKLRDALGEKLIQIFDSKNKKIPTALRGVSLSWTKLALDGSFDFKIASQGKEPGWIWILTGSPTWIGVQEDAANQEKSLATIIPLIEGIPDQPSGTTSTNCSKSALPQDVTEPEIVQNADLFGDDPGTSCDPFRCQNRILSERSLSTILRIDQPEIGSEPSTTPQPPLLLELPSVAMYPTIRAIPQGTGLVTRFNNAIRVMTNRSVQANPTIATSITQRLDERFKWIRERNRGRQTMDSSHPAEWEGDTSIYQATSISRGHILEFRIRWRSNGYSLGNVIHSLTLAPRQVKRITMVSWERREVTARTERTAQRDTLAQDTTREREYSDAVSSQLSEWSKGGSKSSSSSGSAGLGFSGLGFTIGGGGGSSSSSSSSWQNGGRSVAAQEEQTLHDSIRQYADSLRQLESSVVQETTQEETVTGISEIVRNPNFGHALTVIYYEILRHLRVDTELAGLRECLFVPFAIRPLTIERAIRWRDAICTRLLQRDLLWVFPVLEDVADNFSSSSIPARSRSSHKIKYLSGSLYLQLNIERPKNDAADAFVEVNWLPLVRFLGMSAMTAFSRLQTQIAAERDRVFQEEMAPGIAAQWANTLLLEASRATLRGVDFTLATKYRPNGPVRVDFSFIPDDPLTRNMLQNICVKATWALPPGSVANLQRVTLRYNTETFTHDVTSDTVLNDLVDPSSGLPDNLGAPKYLQIDSFESQDLRAAIQAGADKLLTHLNEHVEYYHKAIWWAMDRDKLYMLLDAFIAPGTNGRSVASVVERSPIAILGNSLVFRVSAGAFLGTDNHKTQEEAFSYYKGSGQISEPLRVSLPTSGLYARALMDKCDALEEHYGTNDWVLTDNEPELEQIGPEGLRSRRAEAPSVTPTTPASSLINLPGVPEAPATAGFGDLLKAVTTANAFRDMAGLSQTQANAAAALQQAMNLASDFGSKAADLQKAQQGTEQAPQKLASIRRAQSDNLISGEDAQNLTKRTLQEMNTSPQDERLTKEPAVESAISNASARGGTPIEVKRGTESVSVGVVPAGASIPAAGPIPAGAEVGMPESTGEEKKAEIVTKAASLWTDKEYESKTFDPSNVSQTHVDCSAFCSFIKFGDKDKFDCNDVKNKLGNCTEWASVKRDDNVHQFVLWFHYLGSTSHMGICYKGNLTHFQKTKNQSGNHIWKDKLDDFISNVMKGKDVLYYNAGDLCADILEWESPGF